MALWLLTPTIRADPALGPVDNNTVLGLEAVVDALDSQVCVLCTELPDEWKDAEEEEER